MRFLVRARLFIWTCLSLSMATVVLTISQNSDETSQRLERSRQIVRRYLLADLCLFPEARYTRHLSSSDRHAPFQDHPTALEHFPSGTLVLPPDRR